MIRHEKLIAKTIPQYIMVTGYFYRRRGKSHGENNIGLIKTARISSVYKLEKVTL